MIAKAKAISHGINDIRYITGESQHKKHPEKIYRVLDNLLPPAPQMILIIRCLYCLHPKMHPEIKNDSLIIILYIKSYLPFLNKLTIVMICDILF